MSDFKIVEVPEEEPERLMEPWEIYMTDPVVAEAVNAFSLKEGVALPYAAAHLAKTVVPAPQYAAAHDARYLLAPETAEADAELMQRDEGLMGWVREGLEVQGDDLAGWPYTERRSRPAVREHVIDRVFGTSMSGRDELREVREDEQSAGLGRDLLNLREDDVRVTDENPHTGVEVRNESSLPGLDAYDVEGGPIYLVDESGQLFGMDSGPQSSEPVGNFFHQLMEMIRQRPSLARWVVPPSLAEGSPQTITVTFTQAGAPTEEARQETWHRSFLGLESHLRALDLIPLSPPLVRVEEDLVEVRVDAVPAQERTFILGVSFDCTAEQLRELAQLRPSCRLLHATDHEGFASAVSWDRHRHLSARALVNLAEASETEESEGSG